MAKTCLKCKYTRTDADTATEAECPQCGAIYAKVELAAAQGRPIRGARPPAFGEDGASSAAPPTLAPTLPSPAARKRLSSIHWTGIVVGLLSLPLVLVGLFMAPPRNATSSPSGVPTRSYDATSADARKAALAEQRAKWQAEAQAREAAAQLQAQLKVEATEQQRLEQAAASGGVWIGMTKQEVEQSAWGRPNKVNSTTYAFGVHEQWVYDRGYLYLQNGKLASFQMSR